MRDWLDALAAAAKAGEPAALVTVAAVEGSAPREAGAKMTVTADGAAGTIGGGHLEYRATELAHAPIAAGRRRPEVRRFALGPSLGQCCGGAATLVFETVAAAEASAPWLRALRASLASGEPATLVTRLDDGAKAAVTEGGMAGSLGTAALDDLAAAEARRGPGAGARIVEAGPHPAGLLVEPIRPHALAVVLFGAGHVGRAVVRALAPLDCRILWYDERSEAFPEELPGNVAAEAVDVPEDEIARAPAGAFFLVMTHSHALDLRLVEGILRRGDFRYLGLIGSATKRARFERRLIDRGLPREALRRLTCPIGVAGIEGKRPAEIAVAVAAEILIVAGAEAAAAPEIAARTAR